MTLAALHIRDQPHYRRHAFESGLKRHGYTIVRGGRPSGPHDLMVIWNRYGPFESMAHTWEQSGGTVLVVENGYLGRDAQGCQHYAISAHGHNGSGWWPVGDEDRFAALRIAPQAWRSGDRIVVRGQRGIGTPTMASPRGWHDRVGAELRQRQRLPVDVVPHPGAHDPDHPHIRPLLERAAGCVVWCSSVAVRALVMGVPVWYDAPHFICADGARRLREDPALANSLRDDAARLAALKRMAWAQWSVAEIKAGEPFARFLEALRTREAA